MAVNGRALIFGGASGIGHACAVAFAKEGAVGIVIADIQLDLAERVVEELSALATTANFKATAVKVDVTSEESVKEAVGETVKLYGRIDYCVNCAGIGVQSAKEISEADSDEFDRFMRVNARGTFLVTRYVSAAMKTQELVAVSGSASTLRGHTRGAIVNLGSLASFRSQSHMVQYTGSKHAVLGISSNAALDNAAHAIRVNCLCPSWVDTPMVRHAAGSVPGLKEAIESAIPLGRIACSDEVADVVIFLCSPKSSYITGSALIVDGGASLGIRNMGTPEAVDTTGAGYVTSDFPGPGLPRTVRHITGYNSEGQSVFLSTDSGDHYRVMGEQQAIANIIYSTIETPVELNGEVDIKQASDNEPPLHHPNGTVARLIDFGPGVKSPMHRAVSLDYGIVLEGVFELTLDSGETRIMRRGDITVQRATAHQWRNITGNGTMPGRMLYILVGCKDVYVEGKKMEGYLGALGPYYQGHKE
ncbi:hypothetical protein NUW58_g1416 [Xylaria curta]|uniref:Uncharacterized protein n=1 Tax=Xylaria curta TaxID=42375 RepID=A0ACC1PKA1_9PEZI|nr:hypothetical protein NUW58_g1416 [Xylaria curta]